MEKVVNALNRQKSFWVVIGPAFAFILLFFLQTRHPLFSLEVSFLTLALGAISWKWEKQGAFLSIVFLFAWLVIRAVTGEQIGFSFLLITAASLSLTLLMIGFCAEEFTAICAAIPEKSFDPAFSEAEIQHCVQKHAEEKGLLEEKIKLLEDQLIELSGKEKVIQLMDSELSFFKAEQSRLTGELREYQNKIFLLEEAEKSKKELEKEMQRVLLSEKERFAKALEEHSKNQEEASKQIESLLKMLSEERQLHAETKEMFENSEREQRIQQAIAAETSGYAENLKREKQLLDQTISRLQFEVNESIECKNKLADELLEKQKSIEDLENASAKIRKNYLEEKKRADELEEANKHHAQEVAFSQFRSFESAQANRIGLKNVPKSDLESVKPDKQLKKAEAMYRELKKQFEEKSTVLDSTRQQLFYKQEEILKLQRELEDKNQHINSDSKALEDHLKQTIKEGREKEISYKKEIESLNELVTALMTRQNINTQ